MHQLVMQSLDAYFGTEAPLNDDDNFLRQYVLNKVRNPLLHSPLLLQGCCLCCGPDVRHF